MRLRRRLLPQREGNINALRALAPLPRAPVPRPSRPQPRTPQPRWSRRHSVYEAGVARFQCEGCAREHLVPFSCKGRAWCPSCGGRRMTERAAHLMDEVLPWVPVRQWVLTVPYRLRYQMAWNHGLSRAVLRVYTRVL